MDVYVCVWIDGCMYKASGTVLNLNLLVLPGTPREVISLKNFFQWKLHEMSRSVKKTHFFCQNPTLQWMWSQFTKPLFYRKVQKCTDLHRKLIFANTPTDWWGGVSSQKYLLQITLHVKICKQN